MGATVLDRELEALLGDSAELIERARLLLVDARARLDASESEPRVSAHPYRTRRLPLRFVVTAPAAAGLVLLGVAVGELAQSTSSTDSALSVRTSIQPESPAPAPTVPQPGTAPPPPPPLWVSIPRLSAQAPVAGQVQVIPSGPEEGLLSAPPDYHDLGWFRQSADGLLVLDGHVGYRSRPGPLAFIGNLRPGDEVVVGTEGGQRSFWVQTVGHVLKGRLPAEYFTGNYGADLMLITCDYSSPFSDGHFADNVYVIAKPEK